MKDKQRSHIFQDLLPLYHEGLLSNETKSWLEEQIEGNSEYEELLNMTNESLPVNDIESPINNEKMFQRINQKLSLYQIIFVAISFILAIQTSILNESFGFILSYSVLGLVSYLFYKNMKIVFFISFIPIFMWQIGITISDIRSGSLIGDVSNIAAIWYILSGAVLMSIIHYVFAFIGSIIGLLILKLKEKE
ncbi:hypothetical protein ACERII_19640 [Evansella sp. AB-rgal1]|uniref:hypothetical protein n=1 Tax=Evansella sp. AB-rgal1 TaxID=3242696 RepID=UPI00359DB631